MRAAVIRERCLFNSVKILCKYNVQKSTSVSTDGTAEDEIHCLKEGEMADDGRESGKKYTAYPTSTSLSFAAPPEADDVDPFADKEEDEEELEKKEVVLENC